jgi:glycosyltransferase involved in cell wall biosynthesis
MPEISILLPTYNGARFLRDQIDSILSQDFPHFELLVVDDGSADDSVAILDSYRARDSRVIRLESQGNRGQVSRLKELLAASSGALVAFADQDDVWDRSKLRLLRAAIGDYPLAFGNSRLIDENGQSLGKTLMEALRIAHRPDDRLGIILSARVSAHAMLCRRSIVDPAVFDKLVPFDWAMSLVAAFAGGVLFVPESETFHRLHGGNSHNGGVMRMLHPSTITVDDLRGQVRKFLNRRSFFQSQLECLATARPVEPDVRATFGECLRICRERWDGRGDGTQPFRTLKELADRLRPHAGSPRDWEHFRVELLSTSLGIPRLVARALLLGYRI